MTRAPSRRVLGDLVDIASGAVPAKPTDDPHGEPFVGIAEISAGGAASPRHVGLDDVPPGASRLQIGDVAVALMSSIGSSLLVSHRHEGAVLGRECAVLRSRTPEATGPWLYVWTQSEDFAQQVERSLTGTTMPRLNRRALSQFTVPLPDLERQLKAQAVIADFDEALAKAGRVLADLSELRRIELQLITAELEVSL